MSNPYKDNGMFQGSWRNIQAEYCNDLVRVLQVHPIDAEKMATDIAADLGRIESLKAKSGKIGKFNKDALADFKVTTEDLQVRINHRLYCYRLMQQISAFRKEFGADSVTVMIPKIHNDEIIADHEKAVKQRELFESKLEAESEVKSDVLESAGQAK